MGDEIARLRPALMRFAMLRLHNRERAEDAVQEALLAALEGMAGFGGRSSLHTWVAGILKHKIVDCLRTPAPEAPAEIEGALPGSDPEESLAQRRFVERVEEGLRRLPGKGAQVFVLREVLGLDTGEVCERLALSPSCCCVTLHRAKARLRELAAREL